MRCREKARLGQILELVNSLHFEILSKLVDSPAQQNCKKKLIMQRYNLAKKLFDFEEEDSESSANSIIYISSDSEDEASSDWDSDWFTDTEAIIDRIEREVKAVPIPIAGRGMTIESSDNEMVAGPSNAQPVPPSTPKLGFKYFNREM